jgi:hypothetical protein
MAEDSHILGPGESPTVHQTTDKLATDELRKYLGGRQRTRENPYLKTQLAQIIRIETDEDGNYTGRATVELLTMLGVRASVIMPITSSQYMFFGGLPPENTLCTVGWMPQGVGVILNYYPIKYTQLVKENRIRDLEKGEVLLQAELTENGAQRAGATVLLDKEGQVIVKDMNETVTITVSPTGNVTIQADADVIINADTKVTLNCNNVNLGGEAGKNLVTDDFISHFNSHTHSGVTTGGGTSATPVIPSTGDTTTKTKAE